MTGDPTDALLSSLELIYGVGAELERASIVLAAVRRGVLIACREPATTLELAEVLSLEPTLVDAVCDVLLARGVLDRRDDRWVVSAAWAPLAIASNRALVDDAVGIGSARAQLLRAMLTDGDGGWRASDETTLAIARGVTFDPATDLAVELRERSVRRVPGVAESLSAGGRYLELGCGVGGAMLALMRVFPRASAIGVELSEVLADAARAGASALGLDDRVRVVTGDATEFVDDDGFDVCFWSQFFFPGPTRAPLLSAARGALKPGGVLLAPAPDFGGPAEEPVGTAATDAAVERLLLTAWDIPARSAAQLVAEVTAAGFSDVRIAEGGVPTLVARRPSG